MGALISRLVIEYHAKQEERQRLARIVMRDEETEAVPNDV
jgi:hypothetical protein